MAIPFYAGIALGHIGRHSQRRHGLCRPLRHQSGNHKYELNLWYVYTWSSQI